MIFAVVDETIQVQYRPANKEVMLTFGWTLRTLRYETVLKGERYIIAYVNGYSRVEPREDNLILTPNNNNNNNSNHRTILSAGLYRSRDKTA